MIKLKFLYFKLLIFCFLLADISCKSQYTNWEQNRTISQIEFEKIRYQLMNRDTVLIIGHLKNETIIGNYPCAAGLVHLTKDFELQFFRLSKDYPLDHQIIEKDTWVSLKRKGYLTCVLPENKIIQGHFCIGGGGQQSAKVSFDLNGNLRSFFTPYDVKIGNIFCNGGKSNEIGLLKNGSLEFCTLSIDHNIHDVKYKAGSTVRFDYNGNVSSVKTK